LDKGDKVEKYIEKLAVSKFFDKSNDDLVKNDVIDYIRSLKINASPYERLHAAISACDRLDDKIDFDEMGFKNFRQAAHELFY
jgi:hypothetical protein